MNKTESAVCESIADSTEVISRLTVETTRAMSTQLSIQLSIFRNEYCLTLYLP
jgi:hypothetical protein